MQKLIDTASKKIWAIGTTIIFTAIFIRDALHLAFFIFLVITGLAIIGYAAYKESQLKKYFKMALIYLLIAAILIFIQFKLIN